MTNDEGPTSASRAAELLARDDARAPARSIRGWARAGVRAAVLRVLRPYTHPQRELDERLVEALREHETGMEALREQMEARDYRLDRIEAFVSDMTAALESLRQRSIAAEQNAARSAQRAGSADERAGRLLAAVEELRALPYMAGDPVEPMEERGLGKVLGFRDGGDANARGEYVAFEDVFRGPASRVQEAQRPYVELVKGHEPVLDVGCGRGEFLELLSQAGIQARGVDSDEGMVMACHARGLTDVVHADANAYLQGLRKGEVGAIFAAQVVEHMPYATWHRFLALSLEKLEPGGHLIFETVNPHRLASLKNFWIDPTHCQPIFPEVALVVCRILGFSSAYAFAPGGRDFERERFTAPAYAVLAAKADTRTADN
jgi:SAM-dependent methyltransferase